MNDLLHRLDAVVLVVANLSLVAGVLIFGWSLPTILMTYWAETAVLGLAALAQIAWRQGKVALILVPFFTVHLGIFMLVHLAFLNTLLIEGLDPGSGPDASGGPLSFFGGFFMGSLPYISPLALLGLAIGHFISAMLSTPRPIKAKPVEVETADGEPRKKPAGLPGNLGTVYGRIAVMQFTIILGGFFVMLVGGAFWLLILLVIFKTIVDLGILTLTTVAKPADQMGRAGSNDQPRPEGVADGDQPRE